MSKVKSFQLIILAMIVLFIMFPFIGQASTPEVTKEIGPDRIIIKLENELKKNEMPVVGFMHDVHTKAVGDKCTACHVEEKGSVVFKFKRTQKKASMELYHNECVACHKEKKSAKDSFRPLTAECRACHVGREARTSLWEQIKFDKSLHSIHERSAQIKGMESSGEDNCSRCHHQYNEKTKETFFTRGQEEACIYCHKSETKNDIRSIRQASHDSCVKCHQSFKAQNISAGPVRCAGCHDVQMQKQIKIAIDITRLKRNQPDVVVLTGWKNGSKKEKGFMNAVAFNHKFHEEKTVSCKACHHETLKKCSDCHTPGGGDVNGGFVSLEKAMHTMDTNQSCLGCHKEATRAKECAGCHFNAPIEAKNPASCKTCHSLTSGLLETMTSENAAKQALHDLDTRYQAVFVDKIPEEVIIGILSKDYKPSVFPHRKVVQTIIKKVESNEMAKSFHGDQAQLCVGCHHNSPKTLEPPKCASCHSKTGPDADDRPGLKGAYHGQCITCHQKMEVETVLATDCVKCHEEKK
ncbi:MAG: hypothetical protein L3J69_07515 [Desulfobacula sp.]|nr:hypothetical protein [Desulfobacula sp.]